MFAITDGFDLYTHLENINFSSHSLAIVHDLSQTSIRKVLRWDVQLSVYRYTCVHLEGVDNVWADLQDGCSSPHVGLRLVNIPILPSSSSEKIIRPCSSELLGEQENMINLVIRILYALTGLTKVPFRLFEYPLTLPICNFVYALLPTTVQVTIAKKSTEQVLWKHFWSTVAIDLESFVWSCLYCPSTTEKETVPRSFGHSFYRTASIHLLQFNNVKNAPGTSNGKLVLFLSKKRSVYKCFFACHVFKGPDCCKSDYWLVRSIWFLIVPHERSRPWAVFLEISWTRRSDSLHEVLRYHIILSWPIVLGQRAPLHVLKKSASAFFTLLFPNFRSTYSNYLIFCRLSKLHWIT